ncbi:hypothetical protein CC2G_008130 [Coprinopsis cinerea AmutBmut pab1-1]|nr:hypothetical protein CC2G_008130 [Coprinopsis cinerea AmutBmut pab1-1]
MTAQHRRRRRRRPCPGGPRGGGPLVLLMRDGGNRLCGVNLSPARAGWRQPPVRGQPLILLTRDGGNCSCGVDLSPCSRGIETTACAGPVVETRAGGTHPASAGTRPPAQDTQEFPRRFSWGADL